MSVQEKLENIAENTPKVYESGYAKGFEDGTNANVWRDIANITLSEDALPIINRDANGKPFKLIAFRICVKTKIPPTWTGSGIWLRCILEGNNIYSSLCMSPALYSNRPHVVNFYGILSSSWEVFTDRIYDAAFTSEIRHYKKVDTEMVHEFSGSITEIMIAYEWASALPSGTTITIQGIDAQ